MNKKIKILTSFALAAVMTLTCFLTVRPVSRAAYATYNEASASYKDGKYYTALTKVQLTGDLRKDIINVAISQIGYQEASSSGEYSGEKMGSNNYTEYGRWFGIPGGQWCAMFVSWCAYVAGVSSSVIPKHSYTENGAAFYLSKNRAYDWDVVRAGSYTPQPGDVVYFYSGTAGRTVNHIGLVEKYENGVLYTIEGNTSPGDFTTDGGCCYRRQYNSGSSYVKYICNPDYDSNNQEGVEAPTTNGYYTALGYYATTGGLNVRNIPSSTASGTSKLGTMDAGSYFKCLEVVNDADTTQNKKWAKLTYNGSTAYTSLNSANIIYLGETLPEPFDPYSLSTNKSEYLKGEMILVTAKGTRSADWVGVYKKGENSDVDNGGVKAIYYAKLAEFADNSIIINGASNNLGSGGRSDAASFSKGLPVGQYTVKYFKNGTYEAVKSVNITVKAGELTDIDVPEPQWAWDFGQQTYGTTNCTVKKNTDYVSIVDSTGDGWIHPQNGSSLGSNAINFNNAKYAVIKLRITKNYSASNQIELLARSGQIVTYKVLEKTSDWQYVIIDCTKTLLGTWGGKQTWFRIDPMNCKGSECDLDWIAFFRTSIEANEFVFAEKNGLVDSVVTAGGTTPSTATPKPTVKPSVTVVPSGNATNAPSYTDDMTSTDNASDVPTGDSTELPAGDVTGEPTQETGVGVSTDAPQSGETTAPGNENNDTTEAPSATDAPDNGNSGSKADSEGKQGCGSVVYGGGAMAIVLAAAMLFFKKKK